MGEKPLTLNVPYKVMVTGLDWPYCKGGTSNCAGLKQNV